MHGSGVALSNPGALVGRADFARADTRFRPSSREIEGPAGSKTVEPRVMQLLVALADADGGVVSRQQIELICWGSRASDDSIHQAAAAARRALTAVGSALWLETIPRAGYRLRPDPAGFSNPEAPADLSDRPRLRRRTFLAAAAATAVSAGVGRLLWQERRSDDVPGLAPLLAQIEHAWREGLPQSDAQALGLTDAAVKLAPDSPAAWGWQAMMARTAFEYASAERASPLLRIVERSAAGALLLDPGEANALTAIATVGPMFGSWRSVRIRLNEILGDEPDHPRALDQLGLAEMSIGLVAAAADIGARLVEADPLGAIHQHKQVYRLWATGRLADMDRAADRALTLWPLHPAVILARLWTLAFTDRVAAARTMLRSSPATRVLPPAMLGLFDTSFAAINDPSLMSEAINANLALARKGPGGAIPAINHLAALGAVDQAFAVLEAFLLARGALAPSLRSSGGLAANEMHGRKTMMLFLPTAALLRSDLRFEKLMIDTGIKEVWIRDSLKPDYLYK